MSSFERVGLSSEASPQAQEKPLNRQELIKQLEYPKQVIGELYKHFLHYGLTQELLEEQGLDLAFFQYIETINKIDIQQVRDEKVLKDLKDYIELIFEKALPLIKKVIPAYNERVEQLFEEYNEKELERQDEELLELLSPEICSQKDREALRRRLQQLKQGKLVKSVDTGTGTNATLRCELLTDDGIVEAFLKENRKEAAFEFRKEVDKQGRASWYVYRRVFDGLTGGFDWRKDDFINTIQDEGKREEINDTVRCLTSEGLGGAVRAHVAHELGVSPNDVPYDNAAMNARAGILPGEMTARERVNFCLSEFLGFHDLVPVTTCVPGLAAMI